jgi:Immunity protein 35
MLTREGARLQVFLELRRVHGVRSGPNELVILDENTIERPWGWVFFYTTRGWSTGDLRYAIAGNGPLIINRIDGAITTCGTAEPVECYIERYEAELAQIAHDCGETQHNIAIVTKS